MKFVILYSSLQNLKFWQLIENSMKSVSTDEWVTCSQCAFANVLICQHWPVTHSLLQRWNFPKGSQIESRKANSYGVSRFFARDFFFFFQIGNALWGIIFFYICRLLITLACYLRCLALNIALCFQLLKRSNTSCSQLLDDCKYFGNSISLGAWGWKLSKNKNYCILSNYGEDGIYLLFSFV